MVKNIKKRIKIENKEKKFFWVLSSVLISLVLSYGFFLNTTIMNAVAKQNTEKEIFALMSEVNALESEYLTAKNQITIALAMSRGFVKITLDKFATINNNTINLSLSNINEN